MRSIAAFPTVFFVYFIKKGQNKSKARNLRIETSRCEGRELLLSPNQPSLQARVIIHIQLRATHGSCWLFPAFYTRTQVPVRRAVPCRQGRAPPFSFSSTPVRSVGWMDSYMGGLFCLHPKKASNVSYD